MNLNGEKTGVSLKLNLLIEMLQFFLAIEVVC